MLWSNRSAETLFVPPDEVDAIDLKLWQEFMELRIKHMETGVPWFLHDKLKCYNFCRDNGLDTVNVLREFDNPDAIDLDGLPGEFVLKPTMQHSTRGVMVLEKNRGGYFDHMRQRHMTLTQVVDEQAKYYELTKISSKKIIVEEKIRDDSNFIVPRDYKAYSFRGRVALILEINRNTKPTSVAWFDGNFDPIRDGRVTSNPTHVNERSGERPPAGEAILDLARRASMAVPTPFASIDMYSTHRGPIIGEITLTPGGLYYGDHYILSARQQEAMGRMWEEAVNAGAN